MNLITLNDGQHYRRTEKPRIQLHTSDAAGNVTWACRNNERIGLGYTPAGAWSAWRRNLLANLRSPA